MIAVVLVAPTVLNCASSPDGFGRCLSGRLADLQGQPSSAKQSAAEPAEAPPSANLPSPANPKSKPVQTSSVQAGSPPAAGVPEAPTMDLVRAEPDGSVVIAGRGTPDSTVEVFANAQSLGKAEVEAGGDWVLVPEAPLPAGGSELTAKANGAQSTGAQSFVVVIDAQKANQPLVVASTPGKASKVLQGLESEQVAMAPEQKPVAPVQPQPPVDPPQSEVGLTQPEADEDVAVQSAPANPQADTAPTIDAIEIDGNRNFFAGSGKEGSTVRLYVDDQFIADGKVADGRWIIENSNVLTKPTQRIRIDVLEPGNLAVAGRAEVDFVVDLPKPAPAPDIAVAQSQEPKPETQNQTEPLPEPAAETKTGNQPESPDAPPALQPEQNGAFQPVETAEAGAGVEEPEAKVPTLVAQAVGDPEAQRFASGRAIIRTGDNLWTIARRVYGQGVRYTAIYQANADQIRDPDRIYPGQVFDLPKTAK